MTHYLMEFRLHGYGKRYTKRLIYDVSKKFEVKGIKRKRAVPHITLFGPFTTRYRKKMVTEIKNIASKYTLVPFKIKGFDYFDKPNKVIYLDIEPSEELKQLRYEIAKRLRKLSSNVPFQDKHSKNKFKFHATIAFKDIDKKFDGIWDYLKSKEEPDIEQYLLRITILKDSKILYEYDLLQKRLLSRRQSLNNHIYQKTIERLKEEQASTNDKETLLSNRKEESWWQKLKSILRV